VALDILKEKGVPLDRQTFDWREMVRAPISKLDDDAFTRVRVILMSGVERESVGFSHAFARADAEHRLLLAQVRRVEQHQATTVGGLLPADQSALETTIAHEQTAVEVTASLAAREPDPYVAQVLRSGLVEDFDHLYRFAALLDRLTGKDANTILQSHTDLRPGRPTSLQHRAPADDLRTPYDGATVSPWSRLHVMTILASEQHTLAFYGAVGPMFADPMARQLYAEIASAEEEHVTQYECFSDPGETWLGRWLLHEAVEVYNYWSCLETESDGRVKALWERFLDYELGHLHAVKDLFERTERRDAASILPATLTDPIDYASHREMVRQVLAEEVEMASIGAEFVNPGEGSKASIACRERLAARGAPSELVAAGYRWTPGTELAAAPAHAMRRAA
jgi:rubrerythrin